MTNIIIWNENIHEVENEEVKKIYEDNNSIIGIHDHSYLIGSENMEQME